MIGNFPRLVPKQNRVKFGFRNAAATHTHMCLAGPFRVAASLQISHRQTCSALAGFLMEWAAHARVCGKLPGKDDGNRFFSLVMSAVSYTGESQTSWMGPAPTWMMG